MFNHSCIIDIEIHCCIILHLHKGLLGLFFFWEEMAVVLRISVFMSCSHLFFCAGPGIFRLQSRRQFLHRAR